jgi:hypothetical protein
VINRGRQYGKTTTLVAIARQLKDDYLVFSLSFESTMDLFKSDWHLYPPLPKTSAFRRGMFSNEVARDNAVRPCIF